MFRFFRKSDNVNGKPVNGHKLENGHDHDDDEVDECEEDANSKAHAALDDLDDAVCKAQERADKKTTVSLRAADVAAAVAEADLGT